MNDGSIYVYGTFFNGSGTDLGGVDTLTLPGAPASIGTYAYVRSYMVPTKLDALGPGWKKCYTTGWCSILLHTDGSMYYLGMNKFLADSSNSAGSNISNINAPDPILLTTGVSDCWRTDDWYNPMGVIYRKGDEYYFIGENGRNNGLDRPSGGYWDIITPYHLTSLSGKNIVNIAGGTAQTTAVTDTGELYVCSTESVGNSNMVIPEQWYTIYNPNLDGQFHRVHPEIKWSPNTEGQEWFQTGIIATDTTGQIWVAQMTENGFNWQGDYVGYPGNNTIVPQKIGNPWPKISTKKIALRRFVSANYTWAWVSHDGKLYLQYGDFYQAQQWGTHTDWIGVSQDLGQGPESMVAVRGRPGAWTVYDVSPKSVFSESVVAELFTTDVGDFTAFSATSESNWNALRNVAPAQSIIFVDGPGPAFGSNPSKADVMPTQLESSQIKESLVHTLVTDEVITPNTTFCDDGSIRLQGSVGNPGDVITSNGDGVPPSWKTLDLASIDARLAALEASIVALESTG